MENLALWLSIPGIIGFVTTLIKAFMDRKKDRAEATDTMVGTAGELVAMLRADVKDARGDLKLKNIELRKANKRIVRLEKQLCDAGIEPVNGT